MYIYYNRTHFKIQQFPVLKGINKHFPTQKDIHVRNEFWKKGL